MAGLAMGMGRGVFASGDWKRTSRCRIRPAGGMAAGFTGMAKSSSRRSDWFCGSGAPPVNVTAGPTETRLPAAVFVRSRAADPEVAQAICPGNVGIASQSVRANAVGVTESDALASDPVPFIDGCAGLRVCALCSDGAQAATVPSITVTGRVAVVVVALAGSMAVVVLAGRVRLAVMLVVPRALPVTVNS